MNISLHKEEEVLADVLVISSRSQNAFIYSSCIRRNVSYKVPLLSRRLKIFVSLVARFPSVWINLPEKSPFTRVPEL